MTCSSCGSGLGADQKYCVACGQRVGELGMPFVQPAAGAQPGQPAAIAIEGPRMPVGPQMATTFGALAIGFGFVIGSAISPGVRAISAAAPAIVATAPPAPVVEPPVESFAGGGGGTGGSGGAEPGAFVPSTGESGTASTGESSGSGNKKKERKKKKKKDEGIMTLVGTVVHANPAAGSYAVAAGGTLQAVHAPDLPTPGEQVTVQVKKLFNGTFGQSGARTAQGTQPTATFSGPVTYRDDRARVYTVSSRGSSVLVRVPAAGAGDIPPLASTVTVTVSIGASTPPAPIPAAAGPGPGLPLLTPPPTPTAANSPDPASGCDADGPSAPATPAVPAVFPLTQTAVIANPPGAGAVDLEGIVQAVCPGTGYLVISADDVRESFKDIELVLPSTLVAGRLAPGQSISISTSSLDANNAFTVSGFSSDQGQAGAEDQTQGQGTQRLGTAAAMGPGQKTAAAASRKRTPPGK